MNTDFRWDLLQKLVGKNLYRLLWKNHKQLSPYRKLARLHDGIRYEVSMAAFNDALTEIEDLLLQAYHGEEDEADGGDEDLGDP